MKLNFEQFCVFCVYLMLIFLKATTGGLLILSGLHSLPFHYCDSLYLEI